MKKVRKTIDNKFTRTTIFLTDIQNYNLHLLALETGKIKGVLIRQGIDYVLGQHGYSATEKMNFTISNKSKSTS